MEKLSDYLFSPQQFRPRDTEISAFEQLTSRFAAHERQEREFTEVYQDIVDRHPIPLAQFLLRLIILDEEKHHGVVQAMTSALKADLNWTSADQGAGGLGQITEGLSAISEEERAELRRVTSEFIKIEKEGIRDYKELIKHSRGYYAGLFVLLLQTIIHDSKKHLMILEFLDKRLREA